MIAIDATLLLVVVLLLGGKHELASEERALREPDAAITVAAARVEPGRAYAWLDAFQERYPARSVYSNTHAAAPDAIALAFRQVGLTDVTIEKMRSEDRTVANVVGRVAGLDRTRTVVIGAHYDVVRGAPGAIDDAGAIAAMIEAGRVLAAGPPPGCDVQLVIYDGEEEGCVGSFAHVDALTPEERGAIRAMVAVELVGWVKDDLVVHTIPSGFAFHAEGVPGAWLPSAVRAGAARAGVSVGIGDPRVGYWYQGTIRLLRVKTGSDAGAFLEGGIPAVMLTGSALTNFYDGYHTALDGMQKVDSARLDDAAQALVGICIELAAMPDERCPRLLGDGWIQIASRTIGRGGLLLIGLAAAASAAIAAGGLLTNGRPVSGALFAITAVALYGLGLVGGVLGLSIGVPLALGACLAATLPRLARVAAYIGVAPLIAEAVLLGSAVASFGFVPRGSQLEWCLTVAVIAAGLLAATLATRRPRA